MEVYIGLDIGGTKILGLLYDQSGNELKREKKKTKAAEGLEVVIGQVSKVMSTLLESNEDTLMGIGVGVPGLVDASGTVLFSPNIPFENFELAKIMKEKYQVPVVVGNDVNVAMYGEWRHLGSKRTENILGLFIGTGVGGAIILDGKLYVGQGSASEFGHMVVNSEGAYCGCGAQGCLEAYASKTAIQKSIQNQLNKGRISLLRDLLSEDGAVLKSSSLKKAIDAGDDLATDVVNRAARYLGIAIGSLVNAFHPDRIILGGGVIEAIGDYMLPIILNEAEQHAMPGLLKTVAFNFTHLGDEAGVYGAYCLIQNQ